MGASKLVIIASIVFSLFVAGVWAEEAAIGDGVVVEPEASDPAMKQELEQLRSKIAALEVSISDRTRELKNRDDHITKMEKIIQEKSTTISTLKSEMESLQKKGSVDAEELVGKAHARVAELEKQVGSLRDEVESESRKRGALEARASEAEKKVGSLKNELESESRKRGALEARASEAEKKVQELNLKLENLEKTNDEQKLRIMKTERALQVAEEDLMRTQLEAATKVKELMEIHGAWLPPWLATHLSYYQDLVETHWKENAKPTLDVVLQMASEKSAHAQKWLEPHLETVKTKLVPVVKERWVILVTSAEPYVQKVSIKTVEAYKVSKNTIAPHVAKVQKVADPYFQEAKKLSKPYIDQVATATKPHVEKARIALKPYTKPVVCVYKKLLKSATTYHHQLQASIGAHLKNNELTKALATEELVWYMASAILVLTIYFVYRLLSGIFCSKKTTKPTRNGQTNNAHQRPKRRHTDE